MFVPAYLLLLLIIIILGIQRRKKEVWLKQFIRSKKTEDKTKMLELAKRFIDKKCLIYTFNGQISGTIKEVSDGAILIEDRYSAEVVNLDFVVRISVSPRKKNGKEKLVVLD